MIKRNQQDQSEHQSSMKPSFNSYLPWKRTKPVKTFQRMKIQKSTSEEGKSDE